MTLATGDDQIRTARLILRPIAENDLPFYSRIHADPDVARYLAQGNPRTEAETKAWMESVLLSYQSTGLGQLAVALASGGSLIGRCGLSYLEVETAMASDGARVGHYFPSRPPAGVAATAEAELGYTFDPAAWGQGYAREAVAAVHDYTSVRLNRRGIISLIHAENERSMRLASRFGVTYVDRVLLWGRSFDRYRWPERQPNSPSTERYRSPVS